MIQNYSGGNYEVGGGIRSNVIDLLKYGEVFVRNGRGSVSEASVKKMQMPYMKLGGSSYYGYVH